MDKSRTTSRAAAVYTGGMTHTLFLCGDVMTGRGIDQILIHPSEPILYEPYVRDARTYVKLAEDRNGPVPRKVDGAYLWGEALNQIERRRPVARIINLETAITTSQDAWPGKDIQYRMHPANIGCLAVAGIDCCALANNHVLDWGYDGMAETVSVLEKSGIRHAGAGTTAAEAEAPAVIPCADSRILIFSLAIPSSGVPAKWKATPTQAGVQLLEPGLDSAQRLGKLWGSHKKPGDIVVASVHWGDNWGYGVDRDMREFAYMLIDEAGADLVHGHSSHHPRPLELYRGRLVLYGCGDLINDYEGIGTFEAFRPDLSLLYFPTLANDGRLLSLTMVPMRMQRFALQNATSTEAAWLTSTLDRECAKLGCRISSNGNQELRLA